jgi:mannose-6-phosphate isomerase-like protein (cupin superfamily)
MLKNKSNAAHYQWGTGCDGWYLVQSNNLSIIEERMPPGTAEVEHYHEVAEQYFYILKGEATFELNTEVFVVGERSGFYVPPRAKHRIRNLAETDLEFIVISQPGTRGDRIEKSYGSSDSFNLNGRKFRALSNSDNGEVSSETVFSYRQKGVIVWATYKGGDVLFGTLSGKIEGNKLFFTYQHQNTAGAFMTGQCRTEMERVNGLIRLNEQWQWTSGDGSQGTSVLEEVIE